LVERTGEINGREFTGKSQRGGSDADERGRVAWRAKEES